MSAAWFKRTPKPSNHYAVRQIGPDEPRWELDGATDFPRLFHALVDFLPPAATLYFEDGSPSGDLRRFLDANALPERGQIDGGTIWLKPRCYHIPATKRNLTELAKLSESCAEPELAIHFLVYADGRILIDWHDAFDDPIWLLGDIARGEVEGLAEALSMSCKRCCDD